MKLSFVLNGKPVNQDVRANVSLVELLRTKGCWSVRQGCETGDCGSCAVIVNGRARNACIMLAMQVEGKTIETYENLEKMTDMKVLKEALMNVIDLECGYCLPGMLMSLKALVDRIPDPTEEEIAEAVTGNSCRCVQPIRPVEVIMEALQKIQGKW